MQRLLFIPTLVGVVMCALVACKPSPRAGGGRDAGASPSSRVDASAPPDAGVILIAVAQPSPKEVLPGDEDLPGAAGPEMLGRLSHLFEAILQNKAELAVDILFPRDAYLQARDNSDPAKVWEQKVLGGFSKDITLLRRKFKTSDKIQVLKFDLGRSVQQMSPKKHEFKKAFWRVKKSKVYITRNGKAETVDIAEMTSWRGAWYVTNLK